MEHGPAPSPASNHEAPKDAFDAELDNLEDPDQAETESEYKQPDYIVDTVDATLDTSEEDNFALEPSKEQREESKKEQEAAQKKQEKAADAAAKQREEDFTKAEKVRRDEIEATITLRGSQRLDKKVYEWADGNMQQAEKDAAWIGDKKYAAKDWLQQKRIESHQRKLESHTRRAQTAPTSFLRRRYAEKARLEKLRLGRIKGFQEADRKKHAAQFDVTERKDENGKVIREAKKGERTLRREARAEQLQGKINKLIATEYKFAKLGREQRKQKKQEMKGTGDPQDREELRQLIMASGSVESLESVGRKIFVDRLMRAPFVNESVRNAAMRSMQQFEEARKQGFGASQDEFDLIG